jgi:MFS family permease
MKPTNATFALALLFAINTLNFYDRQVLGALTEPLREDWRLDDASLGLLSTAFTLLYAVAGIPIGRLADSRPRKLVLAAGLSVWSLLTAACGLARGYWQLFALRLGVGVGEAACAPAGASLIGDLFPSRRRGRAIAVFMAGLPAGIALSYFVSGRVAAEHGWRAAFFVAGLPGLLVAALALLLAEPERGRSESVSEEGAGCPGERARSPFLAVVALPTMLWIIASGALHNFNMYALGSFLASLLVRFHGLKIDAAGDVSMLISGLGGAAGLFAGGLAADLAARRGKRGRLFIASAAMALSVPLVLVALARPRGDVSGFAVALGAATALMYVYYSGVYATIQDLFAPKLRGTAMAVYFFAMYTLGGALGPTATGALSDHFSRRAAAAAGTVISSPQDLEPFRAEGLRAAMHVIPLASVLLAVVLFMGSRTVAKDLAGRERHQTT